ncbi:MAG: hypothetical protein MJ016_01825 [Victivallaceae bacterium]|nr:hypothetical protein [Victivallaceae bacterium]
MEKEKYYWCAFDRNFNRVDRVGEVLCLLATKWYHRPVNYAVARQDTKLGFPVYTAGVDDYEASQNAELLQKVRTRCDRWGVFSAFITRLELRFDHVCHVMGRIFR